MDERRKAARISSEANFNYEIIDSSGITGPKQSALTKNISATGLLFENKEEIPIGTKLRLVINLPGIPFRSVDLTGEVVRLERLLSSRNYNIGVHFLDIAPDVTPEINKRIERLDILRLLREASRQKASDLHLTNNAPAMIRLYGNIRPLEAGAAALSPEEIRQMVYSILSEKQKQKFEKQKDLDYVFSIEAHLRCRVSVYQQRGNVEVVFRIIPSEIRSREEVGLPAIIEDLCRLTNGIVIIAGTTGSGKTTTIATMTDIINRTKGGVVLSLEKPIEYVHKNIKAIVKQREVGVDVPSFAAGLMAGLRQDPDVIIVGEIVDADTIETALNAAETGHLVITSIHAADTLQVLDRLISLFSLEQQAFISGRFSHCLRAIITQALLPRKAGIERVLATEVCVSNYAVKRIISDRNFTQLDSVIQSGAQQGMHLMQASIDKIYEQGLITGETYESYSKRK